MGSGCLCQLFTLLKQNRTEQRPASARRAERGQRKGAVGGARGLPRAAPSSGAVGAGPAGLRPPWEALVRGLEVTGLPGRRADRPTRCGDPGQAPRATRRPVWGSRLGLLQDPAAPVSFRTARGGLPSGSRCHPAALFRVFLPSGVPISSGPASPLSPRGRPQCRWKHPEQVRSGRKAATATSRQTDRLGFQSQDSPALDPMSCGPDSGTRLEVVHRPQVQGSEGPQGPCSTAAGSPPWTKGRKLASCPAPQALGSRQFGAQGRTA